MLGFLVVVIWCILSLPALVYAAWKLYSERRARGAQRPDSLGLQLSVLLPPKRVTRSTPARKTAKAPRRQMQPATLAIWAASWAVLVGLSLWFITWMFDVWVLGLWYGDVGYANRYWVQFRAEMVLFWTAFALVAAFNVANAYALLRSVRRAIENHELSFRIVALVACLAGALHAGFVAEESWLDLLLCLHRQPFGKLDPVFAKDIGFYVFTLPFVTVITRFISHVIGTAVVAVIIVYSALVASRHYRDRKGAGTDETVRQSFEAAIFHLSALGTLLLAKIAVSAFIDRYQTLYSTHGHVYGAGWTDLFVSIPAYWVYMAVLAACIGWMAASLLSKPRRELLRNAGLGFGGVFVFWLVGIVIVPEQFQSAHVDPNELQVERPYIQRELDATRTAFGLDHVRQSDFPVKDGLTPANLTQDAETLESARLWDWNVLLSINHQLQAFRPYYRFTDVDVVRYDINGRKVQLMYSGRELDVDKLPESAQTWQNTRLVYTHGFGGTASPVNTFTSEGLPDYWVKDLPPVSRYPELEIKQPRIYFGEATQQHIYVNTKMAEFDYPDPTGAGNRSFRYDGPAGIPLGGFFRRLALAWFYDGLWMTWSDELTPQSRILAGRDIAARTENMVPFLYAEPDIYQVVADGQLWYMRDFESVTAWYPYSQPHDAVNYMRNSVKGVVNAYTGKTDFYVFEPADPIVRAYQSMFPGMFQPASAMPPSLRKHVRYPEGLLQTQGEVYASYHMSEAASFYNKEDMWQAAQQFAPAINQAAWVSPYYVVMTLPGNHAPEYVLIMPFTPLSTDSEHQRNNLESWLAARCDGDHYGELILYKFPNTRQVQGPLQVGGRLNQDAEMSKNFTQWNQQGSKVVLGDMRVLPLSDYRLLSVQSIYLQSEGAGVKMPQLMYVVAASGDQVVYEKTFQQALNRLVGLSPSVVPPFEAAAASLRPVDLAHEIFQRLDRYFGLIEHGQLANAGGELERIREALARSHEDRRIARH